MAVTRARSHGRESVFQCPMTHGGAGSARHRHKQHTVLVKTEPGGPHAESRRQHRGSGRIRPAGPGGPAHRARERAGLGQGAITEWGGGALGLALQLEGRRASPAASSGVAPPLLLHCRAASTTHAASAVIGPKPVLTPC